MRELRTCDFCDADAIGAFEIVPPELEPTEAEQRRVVPCPDCKERLETLLEPLLARVGAESGTDEGSTRDATADGVIEGAGDVVATADESTEKRSRTTSPNAIVSDATADSEGRAVPRTDEGERAEPESGSEAESTLGEGITFDGTERAGGDGTDSEDAAGSGDAVNESETAAAVDSSDRPERTSDADSPSDANAESPSGGDAAAESPTRPPAAYNKVVRLLRNREFPMKRSAVEELAAGAYDLESREVEAIVDHAIEDGEFVEKQGTLRRP